MSTVNILCTVPNPTRLPYQLLVFKTIRKGFPTARIYVYGNGLGNPNQDPNALAIVRASYAVGAQYQPIPKVSHGEWIEQLLSEARESFWICDGDIVFFDKVESFFADNSEILFAGRYEPEFWEEWTRTIHVARLHPSLIWFNAPLLRAAIREWPGRPEFFSTVQHNLIQWNVVPELGQPLKFYDTCAGLHQALGGTAFTEAQNDCYGHLFCGTYADLIAEHHPNLMARQESVLANPKLARGLWKQQQEWYRENSVNQKEQNK